MKTLLTALALCLSGCVFENLSAPPDQPTIDMAQDVSDAAVDLEPDIPGVDMALDQTADSGDAGSDMSTVACPTLKQIVCGITYTCGPHSHGECDFDCGEEACDATCADTACVDIQATSGQTTESIGDQVAINRDWLVMNVRNAPDVRFTHRTSRTSTILSGMASDGEFGKQIAIGGLDTLAIAAPEEQAVYFVHNLSNSTPPALSQRLIRADVGTFGTSVAIARRDEQVAIVGAAGERQVFVVNRGQDSWTVDEQNELESPASSSGGFGDVVALNPDGDVAIVGAPGFGTIYLYTRTVAGSWGYVAATDEGTTVSNFGKRVVISDTHVAVSGDDTVMIYRVNGTLARNKSLVHEHTVTGTSVGQGLAFQFAEADEGDLYYGAPAQENGGAVVRLKHVAAVGWFPVISVSGAGQPYDVQRLGTSLSAYGNAVLIGASNPTPELSRVFETTLQR